MKKQWWLLIILFIAFVIVERRTPPNIDLPSTAKVSGSSVVIPALMQEPTSSDEDWVLTRRTDGTFVINVFSHLKLMRSFTATKKVSQDKNGQLFDAMGEIMFDHTKFDAKSIQVKPGGHEADIRFVKAPIQAATG